MCLPAGQRGLPGRYVGWRRALRSRVALIAPIAIDVDRRATFHALA
jgi:hypothetical protein